MIIEEIEESEEYPYCPDCKIPLYHEGNTFTKKHDKQKEKEKTCKHEYGEGIGHYQLPCKKCGFDAFSYPIPTAQKMRCPNCSKLFHVERD